MIDPFTAKIVATVAAEMGKQSTTFVRELFRSEYGAFWKRFSNALEDDRNVPWNEIEGLRIDPEFVGVALSLIRGNTGARGSLRAVFKDIELPETAYEDQAAVQKKIFDAAMEAAVKATADGRDALFATERRIEETIRTEAQGQHEDSVNLDRKIERLKEEFAASESEERLQEQVDDGFQKSEELQREFSREQLEKLDAIQSQVDELVAASRATPTSDDSSERDATGPVGEDHESAEDLLDRLATTDEGAAGELRAAYRNRGTLGVIEFLRGGGDHRSVAQLDTAAEIACLDGYFAEAERGHLAAARNAEDLDERARHLVRAAAMAEVAGAEGRSRTHLERARRLKPDHPSVRIANAQALRDGAQMIAALDGVEADTVRQQVAVLLTRAQGWLLQGRPGDARAELDEVEATGVNTIAVREMKALVGWTEGKVSIRDRKEIDAKLFLSAAREFESVAVAVERQGRSDQAAQQRARAAECYALGDQLETAVAILERIDDVEALPLSVRESLARGAMVAQRPDLVPGFLPDRGAGLTSAEGTWADGILLNENSSHEEVDEAVLILERLLTSNDEELRTQAAFALLAGAAVNPAVVWSDAAAAIVNARMPLAEATMRAQILEREGEFERAENTLLPFASDPKALRQLRDHAAIHTDWSKARDRAAELVDRDGRTDDRLALADATAKSGDPVKGRELFLAIARDLRATERLRGMGYSGAIEIASQERDFEEIRRLAEEWRSHLPGEEDATWNLLFALARLAQHSRALQVFHETNPDPGTEQRASLLAEILGRAAPKLDALRQIAALSDRYDRKVEALEGLFLKVSLEAEHESSDLPADMQERIRDAWATFPDRFPDQEFMQVFEAPSTLEGFEQLLKEMGAGNAARAQQEAIEAVAEGRQPVNAVTLASPHGSIGRSWLGLSFLPLGFSVDGRQEEELAAARDAVGGAVIWDSSSLFVVGGLGARHAESLLAVLPGSQTATETLEDADVGVDSIPSLGGTETVEDPDTGAFLGIREHDAESVERIRFMSEGMLDLAHRLKASPGTTADSPTEIREAYERIDRREWRAMIASLALAERTNLPLFSDDRWIRRVAAGLGVKTFGTVALVDALASREVLSGTDRREIRRRLAATGAWGLMPSSDEVTEAALRLGPVSDLVLRGFLSDRVSWRAGPVRQMQVAIALLDEVHRSRLGQFPAWFHRVIESFNRAFPWLEKSRASQVLLLLAWDMHDEPSVSTGCFQAIVQEVRRLPPWLRVTAPVHSAIAELMSLFAEQSEQIRFLLFMRVIARLRAEDAVGAFCRFVEPGPPLPAPCDST